ncbi:hypothetical protein AURDEDRAFT_165517 [Auricularia subglabra TFB-10046 SS5]|nr:hypothetical protein AURDEDRAFT_165517 [Auricularia subglabra TFB-10046 SS5]
MEDDNGNGDNPSPHCAGGGNRERSTSGAASTIASTRDDQQHSACHSQGATHAATATANFSQDDPPASRSSADHFKMHPTPGRGVSNATLNPTATTHQAVWDRLGVRYQDRRKVWRNFAESFDLDTSLDEHVQLLLNNYTINTAWDLLVTTEHELYACLPTHGAPPSLPDVGTGSMSSAPAPMPFAHPRAKTIEPGHGFFDSGQPHPSVRAPQNAAQHLHDLGRDDTERWDFRMSQQDSAGDFVSQVSSPVPLDTNFFAAPVDDTMFAQSAGFSSGASSSGPSLYTQSLDQTMRSVHMTDAARLPNQPQPKQDRQHGQHQQYPQFVGRGPLEEQAPAVHDVPYKSPSSAQHPEPEPASTPAAPVPPSPQKQQQQQYHQELQHQQQQQQEPHATPPHAPPSQPRQHVRTPRMPVQHDYPLKQRQDDANPIGTKAAFTASETEKAKVASERPPQTKYAMPSQYPPPVGTAGPRIATPRPAESTRDIAPVGLGRPPANQEERPPLPANKDEPARPSTPPARARGPPATTNRPILSESDFPRHGYPHAHTSPDRTQQVQAATGKTRSRALPAKQINVPDTTVPNYEPADYLPSVRSTMDKRFKRNREDADAVYELLSRQHNEVTALAKRLGVQPAALFAMFNLGTGMARLTDWNIFHVIHSLEKGVFEHWDQPKYDTLRQKTARDAWTDFNGTEDASSLILRFESTFPYKNFLTARSDGAGEDVFASFADWLQDLSSHWSAVHGIEMSFMMSSNQADNDGADTTRIHLASGAHGLFGMLQIPEALMATSYRSLVQYNAQIAAVAANLRLPLPYPQFNFHRVPKLPDPANYTTKTPLAQIWNENVDALFEALNPTITFEAHREGTSMLAVHIAHCDRFGLKFVGHPAAISFMWLQGNNIDKGIYALGKHEEELFRQFLLLRDQAEPTRPHPKGLKIVFAGSRERGDHYPVYETARFKWPGHKFDGYGATYSMHRHEVHSPRIEEVTSYREQYDELEKVYGIKIGGGKAKTVAKAKGSEKCKKPVPADADIIDVDAVTNTGSEPRKRRGQTTAAERVPPRATLRKTSDKNSRTVEDDDDEDDQLGDDNDEYLPKVMITRTRGKRTAYLSHENSDDSDEESARTTPAATATGRDDDDVNHTEVFRPGETPVPETPLDENGYRIEESNSSDNESQSSNDGEGADGNAEDADMFCFDKQPDRAYWVPPSARFSNYKDGRANWIPNDVKLVTCKFARTNTDFKPKAYKSTFTRRRDFMTHDGRREVVALIKAAKATAARGGSSAEATTSSKGSVDTAPAAPNTSTFAYKLASRTTSSAATSSFGAPSSAKRFGAPIEKADADDGAFDTIFEHMSRRAKKSTKIHGTRSRSRSTALSTPSRRRKHPGDDTEPAVKRQRTRASSSAHASNTIQDPSSPEQDPDDLEDAQQHRRTRAKPSNSRKRASDDSPAGPSKKQKVDNAATAAGTAHLQKHAVAATAATPTVMKELQQTVPKNPASLAGSQTVPVGTDEQQKLQHQKLQHQQQQQAAGKTPSPTTKNTNPAAKIVLPPSIAKQQQQQQLATAEQPAPSSSALKLAPLPVAAQRQTPPPPPQQRLDAAIKIPTPAVKNVAQTDNDAPPRSIVEQQKPAVLAEQQPTPPSVVKTAASATINAQAHAEKTPPLLNASHFPAWASAIPDEFPDRPKLITAITEARRANNGLALLHPALRSILLEAERTYNVDEWNIQFNLPKPMLEALSYVKKTA